MIKYLKYFQFIILFQVVLSSFLISQLVKTSNNLIYSSKTGNLYTGEVFALYEDGTKSIDIITSNTNPSITVEMGDKSVAMTQDKITKIMVVSKTINMLCAV